MNRSRIGIVLVAFLVQAAPSHAGLYYSGETFAELPSQWHGFLLDQRILRNIAVAPAPGTVVSPARLRYQEAAKKLEVAVQQRKLTADEASDLGGLLLRLGDTEKALQLLRQAQREHPNHFHLVANLGTAWQMQGDLDQAALWLTQAIRLAPGKMLRAEEFQLKLIHLRQRESKKTQELDDLFGIRFTVEDAKYAPGRLADPQRKKLPSDAVALTQQLALWLPADARLLWQLGELANAFGDLKTAAAIMDGCVNEFGLRSQLLKEHRQATRAATDEVAQRNDLNLGSVKTAHNTHEGSYKPRSRRPLLTKLESAPLPPIQANGINVLPWPVFTETALDRKYRPTFSSYLQDLNGKKVSLSGFMQPLGEDLELASFMLIEYPVGCWYCEMPEITAIVLIEMPEGKLANYTRGLVKIEGTLNLNGTDPENFLYIIKKAKVKEAD